VFLRTFMNRSDTAISVLSRFRGVNICQCLFVLYCLVEIKGEFILPPACAGFCLAYSLDPEDGGDMFLK
jgi:hypothetical protein